MSKKKSSDTAFLSGYVPASFNPSTNPTEIAQIPPYDDPGISFKGYSKRIKSLNEYQLFPQIRRTQTWSVPPATTSGTGTRLDPGKTFYVASIHVDYLNSSGAPITINLLDGSTTEKIRASFVINNDTDHFDIDFISSPRDFLKDNISIVLSAALAAGNYCRVLMIGWAE